PDDHEKESDNHEEPPGLAHQYPEHGQKHHEQAEQSELDENWLHTGQRLGAAVQRQYRVGRCFRGFLRDLVLDDIAFGHIAAGITGAARRVRVESALRAAAPVLPSACCPANPASESGIGTSRSGTIATAPCAYPVVDRACAAPRARPHPSCNRGSWPWPGAPRARIPRRTG